MAFVFTVALGLALAVYAGVRAAMNGRSEGTTPARHASATFVLVLVSGVALGGVIVPAHAAQGDANYRGSMQAARDMVAERMGYRADLLRFGNIYDEGELITSVQVDTPETAYGYTSCLFIIGRDKHARPYGWGIVDASTRCDRHVRSPS